MEKSLIQQRTSPLNAFDETFLTGIEGRTEIVLVRHGQQVVPSRTNASVGETVDPPLSEQGEKQAQLVGERFSTEAIAAVYASPLLRAFATGMQIASHHQLEPIIVDDLREVELFRDVPPEQSPAEAFGESYLAGLRSRMMRERSWDIYPLSETSTAFRKRTINAIEGIIAGHEGDRVVVACHGGVINAYAGYVVNTPYDMFFRPAHASVHLLAAVGTVRSVLSLNDVHHLETTAGSFVTH